MDIIIFFIICAIIGICIFLSLKFKLKIYIFNRKSLENLSDNIDYANFHWKFDELTSEDCKELFSIYIKMKGNENVSK